MREWLADKPAWRLALGAMLLSFAPIMVRATESPPTTSAFYRMFLGGLMLLLFVALRRGRFAVSTRTSLILIAAGIAFALDMFFWHRSIHMVGPGLASLLSGFQVFILAIVGVSFLGERLRWQLVVAIPAAFLGVAMIIGVDWSALSDSYRTGILFGLMTAVCYSSFLLIMRWVRSNATGGATPMSEVAWMSLASAAILALLSTTTGESLIITNSREGLLLVGYAVLAQLGLVVSASSLNKVPASLVGLLLLLEPTFAYVWDILIYERPVTTLEFAGASLALAAIYLGSTKSQTITQDS